MRRAYSEQLPNKYFSLSVFTLKFASNAWTTLQVMNTILLRFDVEVYYEVGSPPLKLTNIGVPKTIQLCLSAGNHYDSVYTKEHIENSGFAQSLVYGILYKDVFKLAEVDSAVDEMLHQKVMPNHYNIGIYQSKETKNDSEKSNMKMLLQEGITPFPYKVAKALEPTIYRNIDFDIWSDIRKEMRFAMQTVGDLQVGMKCLVILDQSESSGKDNQDSVSTPTYHAHIQSVKPDKGPVEVYVEELGERMTVSYEQLEPIRQTDQRQPLFLHQYRPTYRPLFPFMCKKLRKPKVQRSRKSKPAEEYTESVQCGSAGHQYMNADHPVLSDQQSKQLAMISLPIPPQTQMFVSMGNRSSNPQQLFVSMPHVILETANAPLTPEQSCGSNTQSNSPLISQLLSLPPNPLPNTSVSPSLQDCSLKQSVNGNITPTSSAGYATASPSPSPPTVEHSNNQMINMDGNSINFWAPKSEQVDGNDLPFQDLATVRFFYNLGHDYFHNVNSFPLADRNGNVEVASRNVPEVSNNEEDNSTLEVSCQVMENTPPFQENYIACNNCYPYPAHTVMYYPVDVAPRPPPCFHPFTDSPEGRHSDLGSAELNQTPVENGGVFFNPPTPSYIFHQGGFAFPPHLPPDYPSSQMSFSPVPGNFSPPINGMSFSPTPSGVYPPTPHGVPFSPTPNRVFTFTPSSPSWFGNQHNTS